MKLYYDKNNSWEISSSSICNLCSHIINCLDMKRNCLSIKQCAKLIYVMNQSVSVWSENEYLTFLKKSPNDLIDSYNTTMKSSKGSHNSITRENIKSLKSDFEFLLKMFSHILACMVLDNKRKLFIEKN